MPTRKEVTHQTKDGPQADANSLAWFSGQGTNPGEDLLMGEDANVVLARLEGRVEVLTEVVEVRLRTMDRDVEQWRSAGVQERNQLSTKIERVVTTVDELQEFKSKAIGIGIGLMAGSGIISGFIVTVFANGG